MVSFFEGKEKIAEIPEVREGKTTPEFIGQPYRQIFQQVRSIPCTVFARLLFFYNLFVRCSSALQP
ncbi:MAG: hypothetical protein WCK53_15745, partial [Methanomicrobiales archaeon]